jgi:hypothetical protein
LQDGSNIHVDGLKKGQTILSRLTKCQNGDFDYKKVLLEVWKVATFQILFSFLCVFGVFGVI